MVSYFPFDFNHIGRGVTREDPPFDMRRRFCRLFRIAFLKQLDTFFSHSLASLENRDPMAADRISLSQASQPLGFEALRKHSKAYRK